MDGFEAFWKLYPRRVGKLAARREWDRLNQDEALLAVIMAALEWQIPLWDDVQYIPHPRTWIHQGRYLDEPPPVLHKVTAREQTASHNAAVLAELTGQTIR